MERNEVYDCREIHLTSFSLLTEQNEVFIIQEQWIFDIERNIKRIFVLPVKDALKHFF